MLRKFLAEDHREGQLRADIRELEKRNNEMLAVENRELTQISLFEHEIITDNIKPIK